MHIPIRRVLGLYSLRLQDIVWELKKVIGIIFTDDDIVFDTDVINDFFAL